MRVELSGDAQLDLARESARADRPRPASPHAIPPSPPHPRHALGVVARARVPWCALRIAHGAQIHARTRTYMQAPNHAAGLRNVTGCSTLCVKLTRTGARAHVFRFFTVDTCSRNHFVLLVTLIEL